MAHYEDCVNDLRSAANQIESMIKNDQDTIDRIRKAKVVDEQNKQVSQNKIDKFILSFEASIYWKTTCLAAIKAILDTEKDLECDDGCIHRLWDTYNNIKTRE